MARDIGKKKKDREKKVGEKMLRRRNKLIEVRREEHQKEKLAHITRRRQEPIVKHRLGGDTSVPMSEERNIEINQDNLNENLVRLQEMEQEFVNQDKAREHKEEVTDDENGNY